MCIRDRLTITVDDNPAASATADPNAACRATPVLFALGFELAFVAILAKTWRIYRIFTNQKLKRRVVRARDAVAVVTIIITLEVIVIAVWLGVDPLRWERAVVFRDSRGNVVASVGQCAASDVSGRFGVVVAVLHFLTLAGGMIAARAVRHVPSEFGESYAVSLTVALLFQLYLLCVPTVIAVYGSPLGRFIILTTFAFLTAVIMLALLIFPKAYYVVVGRAINFNSGHDLSHQASGRNAAAGGASPRPGIASISASRGGAAAAANNSVRMSAGPGSPSPPSPDKLALTPSSTAASGSPHRSIGASPSPAGHPRSLPPASLTATGANTSKGAVAPSEGTAASNNTPPGTNAGGSSSAHEGSSPNVTT